MDVYEKLKGCFGLQFQNEFSKLMKLKYSYRYQPTSTYGNIGDMKVDGILDNNIAFAVYAPEVYNDSKVIRKIKEDFNGFMGYKSKENWSSINKFIFVLKREREGCTSRVLELISDFNKIFPVDVITMDDIESLCNELLPFSNDAMLLSEFKNDVTKIMEYIINTDFTAVAFISFLSDEIETKVLHKWNAKKYNFKDKNIDNIKKRILSKLEEFNNYLTVNYFKLLPDGRLFVKNDSLEAGEKLKNDLRPNLYRIRMEIRNLLEQLYNV